MEPIEPALPSDNPPDSPPGELILENGRQAGARRALRSPVTLLGQSAGCDIRLNVEGVQPLHCALLPGPAGLVLRDLGGRGGTLVNERRVTSCLLRDGDVLSVGPFRFHLRLTPVENECLKAIPQVGELDALRVQAAAVTAQQAALLDEESRLLQRRLALEKQEEQLATHLEEQRRELVVIQEESRREREQLDEERAGLSRERAEVLGDAERQHDEAKVELSKAQAERKRLMELRRRLWKRARRNEAELLEDLKRREAAVDRRAQELSRQQQQLDAGREELAEVRKRLNGDREVGKRQLKQEWDRLRETQAQRQEDHRRGEALLAAREAKIEERLRAVKKAEKEQARREEQAEQLQQKLTREAQGLENRIRHLRHALAKLEPTTPQSDAEEILSTAVPADAEVARWARRLEAVAAALADQRQTLLEQWQHFLKDREEWRATHAELLPELEQTAQRLDERERRLVERERELAALREGMEQQREVFARRHVELEAWQSRLTAAESAWVRERETLIARQEREDEEVRRRLERMEEVRSLWNTRRKGEADRWNQEMQRCRKLQRLYTTLCEDCERRTAEMSQWQRGLIERGIALEQLEQERLSKSGDPAAAEKTIRRYHKQLAASLEESEQRLQEWGRQLEAEAERLSTRAEELQQRAGALAGSEATLTAGQAEWESRLLREEESRAETERELSRLREQEQALSERCRELQGEYERLISMLLSEGVPGVAPVSRAA